jgi:uncharacterized protein YecT (DUF1311 family)
VKRQRLLVALLVGCGIIAAAAITSCAAFVSPAHAGSPGFDYQPTGAGNAFKFKLEPTGPSFNCNYANAPDEIAICQDPELSNLDRETARLYSEAMNSRFYRGSARASIRRDQAAWLNSRHRCGYDKTCIKDLYDSRGERLAYLLGID